MAAFEVITEDFYNNQLVLEVTGNYYASYSAQRMDANARLRETFQQVIMPVLQVEVPHFPDDSEFSAFSVEVSHHVHQKLMGISSENPENVTAIIPVPVAQRLVDAKTDDQKQAAILDAQFFRNGEPYVLWIKEGGPPEEWKAEHLPPRSTKGKAIATSLPAAANPTVAANLLNPPATPVRIITPESLALLQEQNQDAIDRLLNGLDEQAHFLSYAAPSFIAFRQGRICS